ncbi:MAG: hypothetical protein PHN82_07835 [bacterium]|nr:hypothetical protein [bacterium]
MPTWVVTFGSPQDIGDPGLDGKVFRFPFSAIEAQHIGTPRQSANTTHGRIAVKAFGTLIEIWDLPAYDLVKALFQLAKEHLAALLRNAGSVAGDIELVVNTGTHPGKCPFDIAAIEEPDGAVVTLEVSRKIGFI